MGLYDSVIRGTVAGAKGIFGGAASFARATPTGFMAAGGAVAGGIGGAATGDNYSSTALMRNVLGGAAAGAGAGLGARALFSRTSARAAGSFLGINQMRAAGKGERMAALRRSPVGRLMGASGAGLRGAAGAAGGILGTMAKHPQLAFSGAILAGGVMAASSWGDREPFTTENKDIEQMQSGSTRRGFENSAAGLTFGLHQNRHRGR